MVHRDFKPSNVLVGKTGRICVLDFGLARAASTTPPPPEEAGTSTHRAPLKRSSPESSSSGLLAVALTELGTISGTPKYMAPEQLRGDVLDARTDQFSFCVALYEALYRSVPFGSPQALASAAAVPAEPPKDTEVPTWVRRVVLRGLSHDPAQRFPSMDALLEALTHDPRVARRKWAAALGAVGLVAVATGALYQSTVRQRARCKGSDARLEGVWDANVKDRVLKAFLATQRSYAGDVWSLVERTLDTYAREWTTQATEACEATHLRREQSEEVLLERMGCLELRLEGLSGMAKLLSAADAALVERAPEAIHQLASPRDCADVAALLRARTRGPQDEESRAKHVAVRKLLVQARTHDSAGQWPKAMELAQSAQAAAAPLADRALDAEVLEVKGWVQVEMGDFKAGAETLADASFAAVAGDNNEALALAASKLVFVFGDRLRDFAQGALWSRHAAAVLERALAKPPLEAANGLVPKAYVVPLSLYLNNTGLMHMWKNEPAEALKWLEPGVSVYERNEGPLHPEVAKIRNNIGVALMFQAQYDKAREVIQRSFDAHRQTLGGAHPYIAMYLLNMGESWAAQGAHERALGLYVQALKIWKDAYGELHPYVATAVEHEGGALLAVGKPREALTAFERALAIHHKLEGPNGPRSTAALAGIGRAKFALGEVADGVMQMERALALGGDVDDPRSLAHTRFALARALDQQRRDKPRAVALAREALAAFRALDPHAPEAVEITHWLAAR
jgi:tetratricopeptide (TPR) repeat protein